MDPIEKLSEELEALRSEIVELDAVDEPSEEQSARYDTALDEFEVKRGEYDRLVARAERVEAVRSAALNPANREGHAPAVHIKRDAFEDVDQIAVRTDRHGNVHMGSPDVIERAVSAFADVKHRGVAERDIEALIERMETVPGAAEHALVHGSPAYRSAFQSWLASQGQNTVYSAEEAAAVRASLSLTGANGGYVLPTLLDPTLIKTGTATKNPIRGLSRVVEGTQNVWHGATVGNVTAYWTAEASAMTEGNPTLGSPAITASKMTAYLPGSFEIFEDSNLLSQLPPLIAEAFEYLESAAFVTGSGSGAPMGVVTAVAAVTASRVSPTTGGTFTTASAVDVFKLINALPARYEDSSTWVANKQIFNTIKQMSTGSQGSYFWTDFNDAARSPLLGYPIAKSSTMTSTVTTGSNLILLGDFSQYVIYDRLGTSVEFQPIVVNGSGLPTGERALVAHKRVGGDVTDANAFRLLQL